MGLNLFSFVYLKYLKYEIFKRHLQINDDLSFKNFQERSRLKNKKIKKVKKQKVSQSTPDF